MTVQATQDLGPEGSHQAKVIGEVVDRRQPGVKDLAAGEQVAQVGPRVARAGLARAFGVDRPGVESCTPLLSGDNNSCMHALLTIQYIPQSEIQSTSTLETTTFIRSASSSL